MARIAATAAFLAAVLLVAAGAASAQTFDSPAAAAAANRNLTTLLAAVQAADLTSTLSNSTANLTVLAPTNAAFASAIAALDLQPAALLASPLLTPVLTYHVIPGAARAADLKDGQTLKTLQGQTLRVALSGSNVTFVGYGSNATVSTANVAAGNSIVHVIDAVLLPNLATAPAGAPASAPALATAVDTYTRGLAPAPSASSN